MSLETPDSSSGQGDLTSAAARLDALDASVASVLKSSRVRNFFTAVIAVVSIALIGYWLAYAHLRITSELNPDLVADVGQSYLETYIPSASTHLESTLKANAPSVIDEGERRLRALPARLDDQFRTQARQAIDARMPEVQERLYQSMKAGLVEATAQMKKTPGEDDAARFRNLADALAVLYRSEAMKFTDDTYAGYTKSAGDIVNGLNMLAEDKNLTPQQKTQRNLVRDFLILAKSAAGDEPRQMPQPNQ
jgi:hypothetical protein